MTSELPDFFTIPEAARILRLTRNHAYEQAKRYRDTGGAEGICVVPFGFLLRVPRAWLEAQAGGPLHLALDIASADEPTIEPDLDQPPEPKPPVRRTRPSRRRSPQPDDPQLFATD